MNTQWKTFLLGQHAIFDGEGCVAFPCGDNYSDRIIYPLTHLGIIAVSGKDAAKLLQGQLTCNVNDVSPDKSSLAAMCNPKGRAIATFVLIKKDDDFLLVLPLELMETVRKKLQMYVLRSDVKLADCTANYCLLGLFDNGKESNAFFTEHNDQLISVDLPYIVSRKLVIAPTEHAISLWSMLVGERHYTLGDTLRWQCLDIYSGIPWITQETSEEYIPQMLNLDKLGGISFTKGCYTGQEVVARAHYLGKIKREMYLAECEVPVLPAANAAIVADSTRENTVGNVLAAQFDQYGCKLLVILPSADSEHNNLSLRDYPQTSLTLLPFNL
jgi:tRNA-modifying protein YgfZ